MCGRNYTAAHRQSQSMSCLYNKYPYRRRDNRDNQRPALAHNAFTQKTIESFIDSQIEHGKFWQKHGLICCGSVVKRTSQCREINHNMVVRKVLVPCIHKHSTGQIREGFEVCTLRRVDRGAQCAFDDPLSSVYEEQLGPPLSGQDTGST